MRTEKLLKSCILPAVRALWLNYALCYLVTKIVCSWPSDERLDCLHNFVCKYSTSLPHPRTHATTAARCYRSCSVAAIYHTSGNRRGSDGKPYSYLSGYSVKSSARACMFLLNVEVTRSARIMVSLRSIEEEVPNTISIAIARTLINKVHKTSCTIFYVRAFTFSVTREYYMIVFVVCVRIASFVSRVCSHNVWGGHGISNCFRCDSFSRPIVVA